MRLLLCLLFLPWALVAQTVSDPLDVTLPTGKVVHFPTAEAKAKYLAALAARQQLPSVPTAPPPPLAAAGPKPGGLGHTALDDKPAGTGKVNVNAPAFTAQYYMLAPETWVGKKVTLSVASLSIGTGGTRKDGLQEMQALTENTKMNAILGQEYGGSMTVVAKPEVAQKLLLLCGTSTRYLASGLEKTTMIRGEFRAFEPANSYNPDGAKHYAVFVEQ